MSHGASEAIPESSWQALVAALRDADRALLLAHVSPDADALGSALAVGLALRHLGVEVTVSFGDDPFVLSRGLRTLPGQDLIVDSTRVEGPFDVAVAFDSASPQRLGILRPLAESAGVFACVDHHTSNTGVGALDLIDPQAEATAVLALDLIDRLGVAVDADIAGCLYAGLSTDTGSFKFVSTRPRTHAIAARLLETGIEHHLISRAMYDDEGFASVRLLGAALARSVLDRDAAHGHGVVLTHVSRDERVSAGVGLEEIERIIDMLRITHEAEIALVLKQDDDGLWRASVRSKGAVDVGSAMSLLGGGGHRYAAGATLGDDHADAQAQCLKALASVAPDA